MAVAHPLRQNSATFGQNFSGEIQNATAKNLGNLDEEAACHFRRPGLLGAMASGLATGGVFSICCANLNLHLRCFFFR
jgi:hypothetical protein